MVAKQSAAAGRKAYLSLSAAQKRQAVLLFLAPVLGSDPVFLTLHRYLSSQNAVEEVVLDDIYDSLSRACSKIEDSDAAEGLERLRSVAERLAAMQAQEKAERLADIPDPDDLLKLV